MKNRLIPCVLACLMIFLVGCTSNTAKEAAQEITKTETSFPAGNTETNSQEDTAEEPESTAVREETPITAEESKSTAESQTVATVQTKPSEEKTADTPATEKPKAEPPKQTTTQAEPEKQTEQPKEQTTAEQKPVEKPTEKPAEPKPTEPPKQTFDVSPYVSYAKEYAVSIGLSLDSTATECWDNPISANPNRSGIKSDIESRLNRYKNSEGFIYGHHMNDGSMFAGLMKFKDKNFWEKHKTISFDTLTDRKTYEVIAVFKTVVYTDSPDSFKYYQFVNAETAEDFTAYVEKCKELSLYDTGVTAEYGDKLLTLSTCEYSRTNGRLVVVAKLINE